MASKKARERKFLDEIAQIYPKFPEGEIDDTESPDFLIKQNSKIIGVEIVDYIRGQKEGESIERRNEVIRRKVEFTAKELFQSKSNIPISIQIFWKKRYKLRQTEISQVVNEIVCLAEKNVSPELIGYIRIGSEELNGTLLGDLCHSIIITRVINENQMISMSSGWIEVQIDEIQYLLDTKNNKALEYLRRCDEVWLIIVADGQYITSNIDLTETVKNKIYTSRFENVLVYDRIEKCVIQLRLQ